MKPTEALAKRIIEGVDIGGRMIYREDQSVRTHDFDLHRQTASVAAVEVTSITDGTVKAAFAAIDPMPTHSENARANDWRVQPIDSVAALS